MQTERLNLRRLDMIHAEFMLRLVNTDQWKENIGDRNVNSIEEAEALISKMPILDLHCCLSLKRKDMHSRPQADC